MIEESEKTVPDAYHGTTAEAAPSILQNGFNKSYDDNKHLGRGIYFFEGSRSWALGYARQRFRGRKLAVTRSTIRVGFCLDLTDRDHQEVVRDLATTYKKKFNKSVNDAQAIQMVASRAKVDTIKAVQIPENRRPLFESSRFLEEVRIMWCVRNIANISNTEPFYEGF